MAYLEQDTNSFHREDYYLAQIAAMICRTNAKNPEKIKLKDFILKFETEKNQQKKITREVATAAAKRKWGAFMSAGKRKK